MEASLKEMCQQVEDMILQDRHVKACVIAHGHFSWNSFQYHSFSLDDIKGQFLIGATNIDSRTESMPSAI